MLDVSKVKEGDYVLHKSTSRFYNRYLLGHVVKATAKRLTVVDVDTSGLDRVGRLYRSQIARSDVVATGENAGPLVSLKAMLDAEEDRYIFERPTCSVTHTRALDNIVDTFNAHV